MQVMISMQEVFYQNCKIYGAWVMGSDLKLDQIDYIVQIFQILENLHYSRIYLRKTKCIIMMLKKTP